MSFSQYLTQTLSTTSHHIANHDLATTLYHALAIAVLGLLQSGLTKATSYYFVVLVVIVKLQSDMR